MLALSGAALHHGRLFLEHKWNSAGEGAGRCGGQRPADDTGCLGCQDVGCRRARTPCEIALYLVTSFSRMKVRTRGMICSRHLRPLKMP